MTTRLPIDAEQFLGLRSTQADRLRRQHQLRLELRHSDVHSGQSVVLRTPHKNKRQHRRCESRTTQYKSRPDTTRKQSQSRALLYPGRAEATNWSVRVGCVYSGEACRTDQDRVDVGAYCPVQSMVREFYDYIIGDAPLWGDPVG